ncbi:MAG: universal stress protein [Flavobacteriales bacterium]|nr:universal stress protein [Flavobacteriales bacterium]
MPDLLCTTDLSPASDTALTHAIALGDRLGARVSLLHVIGKQERDAGAKEKVKADIEAKLDRLGAQARILLPDGDFMSEIVSESGRGHLMLVMGTHGPHGLRQTLFGADILKLVRKSAVPSYVVQAHSPVDRELNRIVLPVAGHAEIGRLLDTVCLLAKACAAEVDVYQLVRPGESPSDALLDNKLRMIERLQEEGIRHQEVNEPSSSFSVGFAKATIDYAKRVNAGAIAIMAHASDEFRYIADAEKERILANESGIPVICA